MKKITNLLLALSAMAFMYACSGNKDEKKSENQHVYSSDMEYEKWINNQSLVNDRAHSGKFSSKVDSSNNYSFGFTENFKNISDTLPAFANISVWVNYPVTGIKSTLVVSVDAPDQNIFWSGTELLDSVKVANQWKEIKSLITLPAAIKPDYKISVYVWSNDKKAFYVDDLKVEFLYK